MTLWWLLATIPLTVAFETACNAWITAREPWEESEAFLFGPVDELGLDPNMDSWPLDQNAHCPDSEFPEMGRFGMERG